MGVRVSILFYSGNSKKKGEIVQNIIEDQACGESVERYRSVDKLAERLRQPRFGVILIVLLISSPEALMDVVLIRDLFADIPVILILPDRKKETIAKGHKLYPRFLSYIDGNFADVALVLNKKMGKGRRGSIR